MEPMQSQMTQPQMLSEAPKKKWGWMIAWVVVVIILILAALSYYGSLPDQGAKTETESEEVQTAAIEQELQGLNLDSLDAELGDIEKEISQ